MSRNDRKTANLDDLAAHLARPGPLTVSFVESVGRAVRVAYGDDEDAEGQIERADVLLAEAALRASTQALPATRVIDGKALAHWLENPRGPFADTLAALEGLGAIAAGLRLLAPGSRAHHEAVARAQGAARAIEGAAEANSASMFDAALEATALLASGGVAIDDDGPLVALSEVVATRLRAALGGERLEDVRVARRCTIDASVARRLGDALARAFARPTAVAVSLDALAFAMPPSNEELSLHEQPVANVSEAVEVLPGVDVRVYGDEVEVRWLAEGGAMPTLVPIVDGAVAEPCASRRGADETRVLFTLSSEHGVEGHALVVGDSAALLRR